MKEGWAWSEHERRERKPQSVWQKPGAINSNQIRGTVDIRICAYFAAAIGRKGNDGESNNRRNNHNNYYTVAI